MGNRRGSASAAALRERSVETLRVAEGCRETDVGREGGVMRALLGPRGALSVRLIADRGALLVRL